MTALRPIRVAIGRTLLWFINTPGARSADVVAPRQPTRMLTPVSALAKAVQIVGGQSALAAAIGVKQQNVWWWLNKKGAVSAEYVLPIERATERGVTRYELRPDLYPAEPSEAA